mmetsp:Transcript_58745/g.137120  ORF Transcript_58745/g.137120 Transcript_58745/m.137120 type:complete len:135 (+) Transcript_58745:518-922(+)
MIRAGAGALADVVDKVAGALLNVDEACRTAAGCKEGLCGCGAAAAGLAAVITTRLPAGGLREATGGAAPGAEVAGAPAIAFAPVDNGAACTTGLGLAATGAADCLPPAEDGTAAACFAAGKTFNADVGCKVRVC